MTHEEIMGCLEDTSINESYYTVSIYVYPCLLFVWSQTGLFIIMSEG